MIGDLERSHARFLLRSGLVCLLSSCASDTTYLPRQSADTDTSASAGNGAGGQSDAGAATTVSVPHGPTESAGCSSAAVIQPSDVSGRELIRLSGSTASGGDTSQSRLGGCDGATGGPELWYQLDLQAATRAIDVRAILDASFDAVLDLRRGPCADTLSLDCDRASALGAPSSALAARLEPGVYWLVVDGKDGASHGDFQLQVELDPGRGACSEPPLNLSCETALPLPSGDLQTLFVDAHCTTLGHMPGDEEVRYYSLDLNGEAAPVVVRLARWDLVATSGDAIIVHRENPQTSGCGETVAGDFLRSESVRGGAEVTALLEPGRYIIELQSDVRTEPGPELNALTVRLDRAACSSGPVGDTCEDAIELETGPGAYVLEGSTLCNSDHVTLSDCSEASTPDQFYRLDLRAETAPTRTRLTLLMDGLRIMPLMYLLADDGAGGCGRGLYCVDFGSGEWEGPPHYDLNLAPDLYFIGVESSIRGAGSYRLLVELDRTVPSSCVTTTIAECVFRDYLQLCCFQWGSTDCPELISLCGLASETQRCVCERNAACCGAVGDTSGCAEAYAACNYLCPEFAPSSYSCLDPYR